MDIKGICICHRGHTLLRKVYHISYDQIGFLINNKVWLYWNIPTRVMHYIGSVNFPSVGVKIYSSLLRDKYNKRLFIETLNGIPEEEERLLTILRTFAITFSILKSDTMSSMDIFLELFHQPHLEYEDNTLVEPICKDLILTICNYPPSFPQEDLSTLCHSILNRIKGKNPIIPHSLLVKLSHLLHEDLPSLEETVLIVHENGKLKESLINARNQLLQLMNKKNESTINVKDFIVLLNSILFAYGESEIPITKNISSVMISFGDDSLSLDNRRIPLSLAGDNVNQLTKEEIERLLYLMDEMNCNSGYFDGLRSLLINHLYNIRQGTLKKMDD